MKYNIMKFLTRVKRLIRWIPVIWKQYDFDYNYALDVFKLKLTELAEFLESDKAHTSSAKVNAGKIRTVLKLMDKVYNGDYETEYQYKLNEEYGEELLEFKLIPCENKEGYSELKYSYELTETPEKIAEINARQGELIRESIEKRDRAHKLLWELIEHNIQKWWD